MSDAVRIESNSANFWRRTRTVAFWSVIVGVALELLILGIVAIEKDLPESARAIAQVASKVSWSGVVCFGISCGLAASNSRAAVMGFLGAVSGPVGFAIARSVHKGTLQAISNARAVASPELLSPYLLAGIKALEYGLFGIWLGRLTQRDGARIGSYVRAGATIGIVFAVVIVSLFKNAKPDMSTIELGAKGVNELVFPLGCAFVLFVTKRTSAVVRPT
ncbi:MAG: hypothetical protein SGI72_16690 [Planctomycetota bacterium]|nr:hypothetical protein [Planctomycetota bacterium]